MGQTSEESVPGRSSNVCNLQIRMMRRTKKRDGEVGGIGSKGHPGKEGVSRRKMGAML